MARIWYFDAPRRPKGEWHVKESRADNVAQAWSGFSRAVDLAISERLSVVLNLDARWGGGKQRKSLNYLSVEVTNGVVASISAADEAVSR